VTFEEVSHSLKTGDCEQGQNSKKVFVVDHAETTKERK
jgi:hypothetical protein